MNSFQEGDWVIGIDSGRIGYLKSVDNLDMDCVVQWTLRRDGLATKAVSRSDFDEIELLPLDIQAEDIVAMQHLAVEIGDYGWFKELGKRLEVATYEQAD